MKNLIINNPYRILGVYVGDSPAVEQKNLARFRAFEKVGQTYDVSLVGEEDLPKIERSAKSAQEAAQLLSLPQDRIKYSLLWLSDGSTQWGKTLNQAVRSILKNNYLQAITEYDRLINTDTLREEYISAVTNGIGNITQKDLYNALAQHFKEDNDYLDYLYNSIDSDSIPSSFLSYCTDLGQLENNEKKALQKIEDLRERLKQAPDFYKILDKIKQVYEEVEKEISLNRKVYGVESVWYQESAVRLARAAYGLSTDLVLKIGNFVWNQKYKESNGYKKYQTKMLMPVIRECMRLIKETDDELKDFITSLKLTQSSQVILYEERQSYQTRLSEEYLTDPIALPRANRRFLITRGITVAAWLTIVISIIVATMT